MNKQETNLQVAMQLCSAVLSALFVATSGSLALLWLQAVCLKGRQLVQDRTRPLGRSVLPGAMAAEAERFIATTYLTGRSVLAIGKSAVDTPYRGICLRLYY